MDRKKILIIEDESIIAMNVQNLLEQKGYEVIGPAIDGKEAINMALAHKPDLILADIMLQGKIDGITAIEEIQKNIDIPVVYLTAHSNDDIFNRARATKPYGYLIKPASQNDIYSAVDLALYKHGMESRLRMSEARYRSLFDNSKNAIVIYGVVGNADDFIILDFNRAAEGFENTRRDDIVGKKVRDVFPGVVEFRLFAVFQEVWRTGIPRSHPLSMYHDDRIIGWKENFVFKLPSGEIVAIYSDETAKKQAEEALSESEERFRAIVNNSQAGYFFMDKSGVFRDINDAFVRMHGYESKDEIIGRHYDMIFFEPDKTKAVEFLKRILSGETIPTNEIYRRCKDGSAGYSIFSAYPVKKEAHTIGVEGFAIDITEKKEMEDALKLSCQFNQEIISNAKIGIIVYDKEFNLISWNEFMHELSGFTAEQVLGKNALEIFPHLREHKVDSMISRALQGETVYSPEVRFHVPVTGKSGWVRSTYCPHYNAASEIIGVIELVSDITEETRTKNALVESEKKYRELVENSNSIIFRRNAGGEITYLNEFAYTFFGYKKDEIIGRNVIGTIVPEYESTGRCLGDMIKDISRNPERYAINLNENIKKSGERVWILWTNKAVRDENGVTREILCVGNDITQRKRIEEALSESESSYRSLAENIPGIVYRIFLKGDRKVQFYNKMLHVLTGYAPDDLRTDDLLAVGSLIHPEDRSRAHAAVTEALENRTEFVVQYRLTHKKGKVLRLLEKGKPIYEESGKPLHIDGIIFDMSLHLK